MKIGIFTDTYLPDINGVSTSLVSTESGLKSKGHDIFKFVPNNKFECTKAPEDNTWYFNSFRFYGNKLYRVAFPFLQSRKINDLPLDIVHTHTPFPMGAMGLKLAQRKKLRTIHTYHTRYQEYGHHLKMPPFILNPLGKILMPRIINFVNKHDAVIAPSSGIKRELRSFGVTRPIEIIPTGIDVQKTNSLANAKNPKEILKKYNLANVDKLIISTGRLDKEKNLEFLLATMPLVFQKQPLAHLLIVGDGGWKQKLEEKVGQLGLEKNITFMGFMKHEDIFPIYKIAKVFIFSSLTETQGLAPLEAMAVGLPVVALKATGIEDLITDNQGGFMIEQPNTDEFAQAIIKLLEDRALYKVKSEEARRRADNFSIEKTTQALIDLYKNTNQ